MSVRRLRAPYQIRRKTPNTSFSGYDEPSAYRGERVGTLVSTQAVYSSEAQRVWFLPLRQA
jgi:hypothetical protein